MVLCKHCGQNVPSGEPICPECGNPLSENAYDLDSSEPLQGSYIMPGSPGYVPTDGIKISMQTEGPQVGEDSDKKIEKTEEIIKEESVKEDLKEDLVKEKTETVEEEIQIEKAENEPPIIEERQEIPKAENVNESENSKRASDSGSYSPPKSDFNANIPPAPPSSSSGRSGRKIPKAAIAIGAVVLVLAIFFLTRGKGNKLDESQMAYVGKWTSFAGIYDGMYFDDEEDPNIGVFKIELNEDATFVFDFERKFEGTWEVKDDVLELEFSDGSTEKLGAYNNLLELPLGETKFYFTNGKDSKMKDGILEALASQRQSMAAVEEPEEEPEESKEEPKEENTQKEPIASSGGDGVDIDYWYGEWEGYILETDLWGEYAKYEPLFEDINAIIMVEESTGISFLEVYYPDDEDPILSMYVDIDEEKLMPIITEDSEDAFIFTRYLLPEEEEYFTTPNDSPNPTIKYYYTFVDPKDPNSGSDMVFVLKKLGESWDNEDTVPPKYE